jgi:hypothetical protein
MNAELQARRDVLNARLAVYGIQVQLTGNGPVGCFHILDGSGLPFVDLVGALESDDLDLYLKVFDAAATAGDIIAWVIVERTAENLGGEGFDPDALTPALLGRYPIGFRH